MKLLLFLVIGMHALSCHASVSELKSFVDEAESVDFSDEASARTKLILNENAQERVKFIQEGFEVEQFWFAEKDKAEINADRENIATSYLSLKDFRSLKDGESLGVKLSYRYPETVPDRARWLKLKVGNYVISMHTKIELNDLRDQKKKFSVYMVPFAMLAREETSIWTIVTRNKDSLRLSILDAEKTDTVLVCEWPVTDWDATDASFGMMRSVITERPWHEGPSHLFQLAFVGTVDLNKVPVVKNIPENKPGKYMLARLNKFNPRHADLRAFSFDGPLTEEEVKRFRDYYVNRMPLPNYDRHFGSFSAAGVAPWIYEKTSDVAVLDKLILACQSVYESRNDIDPNLQMPIYRGPSLKDSSVSDLIIPSWPMYQNDMRWFDDQDKLGTFLSVGDFSGVAWSASCSKLIAENPELWSQVYNGEVESLKGKSYRDIADIMIGRSKTILEFAVANYLDNPETRELAEPFIDKDKQLYISPGMSNERAGIVPYFNRMFPLLVGQIYTVKAMRIFGQDKALADRLDLIVNNHMEHFISYITEYERKGMPVLKHPYSATMPVSEKESLCEDIGHGSFDNRCLMFFNEEGYFPDRYLALYANTLIAAQHDDGRFDLYIDGRAESTKPRIGYGGEGYFYLAKFNPEVKEVLWKTHFEGRILQVYGILRTKEYLQR